MMRKASSFVGYLLLLAVCVQGQVPVAQTYQDLKAGLVIHFPEGWKIDRESSAFTIVSFDPKKRPPQMLVPLEGAQIVLTRPQPDVGSIADWLSSERIQAKRGYHISTVDVPTTYLGTLTSTVARHQLDVIPEGTIVVYFFEVENRLLKVALIYRGQKRAEYFESVLLTVIKNLEPGR